MNNIIGPLAVIAVFGVGLWLNKIEKLTKRQAIGFIAAGCVLFVAGNVVAEIGWIAVVGGVFIGFGFSFLRG